MSARISETTLLNQEITQLSEIGEDFHLLSEELEKRECAICEFKEVWFHPFFEQISTKIAANMSALKKIGDDLSARASEKSLCLKVVTPKHAKAARDQYLLTEQGVLLESRIEKVHMLALKNEEEQGVFQTFAPLTLTTTP